MSRAAARKLGRRALLAGGAASALASCAPLDLSSQDSQSPREGGIGGTGIVGLLTGFGSLLINGMRVETDARTRFADAFGTISETDLRPGDALTVQTTRRDGRIVATHVNRTTPLIGRLERRGGALSVNGILLRLEPGAVRGADVGTRVAVAGAWQGAAVVVSRIDPAPEGLLDVIAGDVTRADGTALMANVPLTFPVRQPRVRAQSFATMLGRYDGAGFVVRRQRQGRFLSPNQAIRYLSVDGYLEPANARPGYRISGLGHSFDRGAKLAPFARRRTLFIGPYRGDFEVESGLLLPEDVQARARLLTERLHDPNIGDVLAAR